MRSIAIASSEAEICSPAESSISISRLEGFSLISRSFGDEIICGISLRGNHHHHVVASR